jgi:hypothetical protein
LIRRRSPVPLPEVQDELAINASQVYALVRRGDLPVVKLGVGAGSGG